MGRYANHACKPNAESVLIRGKVYLKAIRRILPGEEITYDYGREYVDAVLQGRLQMRGVPRQVKSKPRC